MRLKARVLSFFRILFFSCAALGWGPSVADAHPHSWIDYQTHIVLNDKGEMIAIKEHWVFDEFYTEFALHDYKKQKGGGMDTPTLLRDLANENLKNLKDFSYFTYVESDGKKVMIKDIGDISSVLTKGHIGMDFTVWLAEPVDASKHKIAYRIYDPTYYISMLHTKKDGVAFEGKNAALCHFDLITPKPDDAMSKLASALDKSAKAPDDMGHFFAQKVSITCP